MKKLPIAVLNRSAVLFLYREPFTQWASALPDHEGGPITPEELNGEPVVYLVPEYESDEEFFVWLEKNYKGLWNKFLMGWTSDKSVWPETRTLEAFVVWFQPVLLSLVYDLSDNEYILEEWEP